MTRARLGKRAWVAAAADNPKPQLRRMKMRCSRDSGHRQLRRLPGRHLAVLPRDPSACLIHHPSAGRRSSSICSAAAALPANSPWPAGAPVHPRTRARCKARRPKKVTVVLSDLRGSAFSLGEHQRKLRRRQRRPALASRQARDSFGTFHLTFR